MIICVKKFSNFILISGTTSSTVMITTTTNAASLVPTGDDFSRSAGKMGYTLIIPTL